jgi:hypothetical protein
VTEVVADASAGGVVRTEPASNSRPSFCISRRTAVTTWACPIGFPSSAARNDVDVYNSNGEVKQAGVKTPIEDWHNSSYAGSLKTNAFQKLFPTMNWSIKQKMAPGAAKDLGTLFTAPPPHAPF